MTGHKNRSIPVPAKVHSMKWAWLRLAILLSAPTIASTIQAEPTSSETSNRAPITASTADPTTSQGDPQTARALYIRQYRVQGAHHLPPAEVEEAVYPF